LYEGSSRNPKPDWTGGTVTESSVKAEIEEEQGEATMKRRVREADIDATKARAEAMFQRKHEAQTATYEYRGAAKSHACQDRTVAGRKIGEGGCRGD
jgi:hypothetical protein